MDVSSNSPVVEQMEDRTPTWAGKKLSAETLNELLRLSVG